MGWVGGGREGASQAGVRLCMTESDRKRGREIEREKKDSRQTSWLQDLSGSMDRQAGQFCSIQSTGVTSRGERTGS